MVSVLPFASCQLGRSTIWADQATLSFANRRPRGPTKHSRTEQGPCRRTACENSRLGVAAAVPGPAGRPTRQGGRRGRKCRHQEAPDLHYVHDTAHRDKSRFVKSLSVLLLWGLTGASLSSSPLQLRLSCSSLPYRPTSSCTVLAPQCLDSDQRCIPSFCLRGPWPRSMARGSPSSKTFATERSPAAIQAAKPAAP